MGTAGLWGYVPAHRSSSVWLFFLPLHRNDFPFLCPLGLSSCRHDACSSQKPVFLQGTTPKSSCPLVLNSQMMVGRTVKGVRWWCCELHCSGHKDAEDNCKRILGYAAPWPAPSWNDTKQPSVCPLPPCWAGLLGFEKSPCLGQAFHGFPSTMVGTMCSPQPFFIHTLCSRNGGVTFSTRSF